jgi:site-specific recombinase XerD
MTALVPKPVILRVVRVIERVKKGLERSDRLSLRKVLHGHISDITSRCRWRHTYATSLVRRGEDIHVVQRLMGHSNIATTSRYLHLSDADLVEAIDRAFPED